MKKLSCLFLSLLLILSLISGTAAMAEQPEYRVAIVQQMDHASLDEIRIAIESQLEVLAEEKNLNLTYKSFNGQNDASMLGQIGAQIVTDDYDAIIPIATLAAQCMVTATEGKNIPIIFAAISDPEQVGLANMPGVTGISDALNTPFILDMALAADPDIQTFGLLYSNSEANSATPIAQAKEYLDKKGIAYLEKTGNTTDEIVTAANALCGRVDAVFTPTDNVVMGAAGAVEEILNNAGIPHYTGADSFVSSGAFATCGVNYSELGAEAAALAVDVLTTDTCPEYRVMDGGIITVNAKSAQQIGMDYTPFFQMANTVKELDKEEAPAVLGAARTVSSSALLSAVELGCIYSLVALALMLSFRVLNVADMTTDGSFTLGCAVSATMAVAGHPILALPCAMLSGAAAGSITAMLQTKMKIPSILAGIITNTGLYTVNLAVMGFSSTVNMMKSATIFTLLQPYTGLRLIPLLILTAAVALLLVLFLNTRLGLSVRATGDNPDMVRASSINTGFTITVGLCAANAMTALSGAVLAQYQKTADINLGTGMVIIGLASLIIGEAIMPKGKLRYKALGAVVGSILYRCIIALALRLDLPSECLKLISAIIVALAIGLPALKAGKKGGN